MLDNGLTVILVLAVIIVLIMVAMAASRPSPAPQPHPQPHPSPIPAHGNIGGCSGTRYGCCPNSGRAKANAAGTNC